MDVAIVKYLQYCILRGSDSPIIKQLFENLKLLPEITDGASRNALQERVLGPSFFIPSIDTFYEDIRYLALALKSIRAWVAPETETRGSDQPTLRAQLNVHFTPDKQQPVEVADGCWEVISASSKITIEQRYSLAYRQLVLAALRRFADLTNDSPIQDAGGRRLQGIVDTYFVSQFQETAYKLGFTTPKVQRPASHVQPPKARDMEIDDFRLIS